MITMKGNLVTLEPLRIEKHAADYFLVLQDEKIHKYTGNTVPSHMAETVALLKKYEEYFFNWMILSNETGKVIGIIRLGKPEREHGMLVAGESEFLASQYWRKGHMKEAKSLFYRYVFEELAVDVLYADVWEGNLNSQKSLESYGYRLVETRTEVFPKTGKDTKKYIYTLRKADYLSRKNTLTFQKATARDIEAVYDLCKKLILDYEQLESIDLPRVLQWVRHKIERSIEQYNVIYANGQKAGYYHFYQNDDGIYEIDDLYVFPEYQNRGIGSAIIQNCCASVTGPVMLYVFRKNTRAVSLYRREGFVITQALQSRYIMRKEKNYDQT